MMFGVGRRRGLMTWGGWLGLLGALLVVVAPW